MKQGVRIVVATDLSDASLPALREATRLAREHEGTLCAVHVYDPMPWVPPAMVPNDHRAVASISSEMKTAIEDGLAKRCREVADDLPGVETVAHEDSNPARGVRDVARARDADLVVVGSHGRTGVGRALMGSVAEHIVRHSPCNVLVVRSEE